MSENTPTWFEYVVVTLGTAAVVTIVLLFVWLWQQPRSWEPWEQTVTEQAREIETLTASIIAPSTATAVSTGDTGMLTHTATPTATTTAVATSATSTPTPTPLPTLAIPATLDTTPVPVIEPSPTPLRIVTAVQGDTIYTLHAIHCDGDVTNWRATQRGHEAAYNREWLAVGDIVFLLCNGD